MPDWYLALKAQAVPLLGTAPDMAVSAARAGLDVLVSEERAVDVGVTTAEQLVDYRLGQAHFAGWLADMDAARARDVRAVLADRIRPIMRPYRPSVVFLSGRVPIA